MGCALNNAEQCPLLVDEHLSVLIIFHASNNRNHICSDICSTWGKEKIYFFLQTGHSFILLVIEMHLHPALKHSDLDTSKGNALTPIVNNYCYGTYWLSINAVKSGSPEIILSDAFSPYFMDGLWGTPSC